MSWLLDLYETYENNEDYVGITEQKKNGQSFMLLPISHTTQSAHIEVLVTEDGNFHSASVIPKDDAITVIPTTEESSSRAGAKTAPYPLHDKLSYVAGDYNSFGGDPKKANDYSVYIKQLQEWSESPFVTSKIESIYKYLSKGELITDLVNAKKLWADENHKLLKKWDSSQRDRPEIFSVVTGDQDAAFVRFDVYYPDKVSKKIWMDPEVQQSFIDFYNTKLQNDDLCFVTGKMQPGTERHANKIRNPADKAKLISGNDTSGFTFRGRFNTSNEVAGISYEVSQKAHNALKWLINRQGKDIDGRVVLVWGNDKLDYVDPLAGGESVAGYAQTQQSFSIELSKAIDGYKNDLETDSKVIILVLDAATTGRMAVIYYRRIDAEEYLDKIKQWHFNHTWRQVGEEKKVFFGAPSIKNIAVAAHGEKANNKVIKSIMERLLPCIIDGRAIPKDIIDSCVRRASNPVAMERWEWEKVLSIACALVNEKGADGVGLDNNIKDRSYLFGRLLAVADVLENTALRADEKKRITNAERYMSAFSQHPSRTWEIIQKAIQPYKARLGEKSIFYTKQIDEILSKIEFEEFNDKPLKSVYLLGYSSQRQELYTKKQKVEILTETTSDDE